MILTDIDKHLVMAEYYKEKMKTVENETSKLFYKMRKNSHLNSIQRIKEKAK